MRTFCIEKDSHSLQDIRQSISQSFNIDIDHFIIEIFDKTYDLYITLDEFYFNDLRTDASLATDKNLTARIRSQKQSAFNTDYDDCQLSIERHVEIGEFQADHTVIWLDSYIGNPECCDSLKLDLQRLIEPDQQDIYSEPYGNNDIDSLIGIDSRIYSTPLRYQTGKLHFFSDIDPCMKFIYDVSKEQNAIFLIIDDISIRTFLPQIFDNVYIRKIYVFIYHIYSWYTFIDEIIDYLDKINVFDHEMDLFCRLARDIARYYMHKSSIQRQNPHLHLMFLKWARTFYKRADRIDARNFPLADLKMIEEQIPKLEKLCENDNN